MLVTIALIFFVVWAGVFTVTLAVCRAAAAGDRARRPDRPAPSVRRPGALARLRGALRARTGPAAPPRGPVVPGR